MKILAKQREYHIRGCTELGNLVLSMDRLLLTYMEYLNDIVDRIFKNK